MRFKTFIFISILIGASGCLRRQAATNTAYNPNTGYISESACLRLISGQSYDSLASCADSKKVALAKPFSCAESCECNCTASLAVAKQLAVKPVGTKQEDTQKIKPALPVKKQIVSVRPVGVKPIIYTSKSPVKKTIIKENSQVIKEPVQNVSSARASLKLASQVEAPNAHIKEVQEALNRKGAKLDVDGQMGDRTVRLLKAFQTMNDLPVTGKADEQTAKALGIAVK